MHLNFRNRLKQSQDVIQKNHTIYRIWQNKPENKERIDHDLKAQKDKPFVNIYQKDVFEIWQTPYLFEMIDHKDGVLLHENDGLIFTIDACPYYPGTCEQIIKWKPPHMNTIDFDLR